MMKRLFCIVLMILSFTCVFSQQDKMPGQDEKSLWETLTNVKKKTDKFNLYLNMHTSFNADFSQGKLDLMAFKMDQLRIEARGEINDWIYYRWRQRLNKSNNGSNALDNLPTSIDYAAVGFRIWPNISVFQKVMRLEKKAVTEQHGDI